jgi:hypothetical protein
VTGKVLRNTRVSEVEKIGAVYKAPSSRHFFLTQPLTRSVVVCSVKLEMFGKFPSTSRPFTVNSAARRLRRVMPRRVDAG